MAEVHRLVEEIASDLGDSEEMRRNLMWIRSHLWSDLNTLTNVGKLASTGQEPYKKRRDGWRRLAPASALNPAKTRPQGSLLDRVIAAVGEHPRTTNRVIVRMGPRAPGESMAAVRNALLAAEVAGAIFRSAQGRWALAAEPAAE